MKPNLIIRASAGTGKTFSLATRFIHLMLFQDANPERILALTFSRAAAREIYVTLLKRLWNAAADDAGAARERGLLVAGLDVADLAALEANGVSFSRDRFRILLRRVLESQHCGTIATLDSFILRIVRGFPLETGFQGNVDVLDGFAEARAEHDACAAFLAREGAENEWRERFALASNVAFARSGNAILSKALDGWRAFRLSCRGACDAWTAESMRRAIGLDGRQNKPTAEDAATCTVTGNNNIKLFETFAKHLAQFTPSSKVFPGGKAGEMAQFLAAHPGETVYEYETDGGRQKTCDFGEAGAAFVRAGVRWMLAEKFGLALDVVRAKLALAAATENAYDLSTRRRGKLGFRDFTDAVAGCGAGGALALENLQFRFDAAFDHWELDEFQDTSVRQWECLRNLVREAAQEGGGRTVMAVGDLKQSIYTWRGGNDAPFVDLMGWAEFSPPVGEIRENAISRRYGRHTVDFINQVFGPANIRDGGFLAGACAEEAVARWVSESCWMEHRADEGRKGPDDCFEVYAVPKPGKDAENTEATGGDDEDDSTSAMKILAPAVCRFAASLWAEHERRKSRETVGILVRSNRDGQALAERMRAMDPPLPVVWEGTDGILDSPVVRSVRALLFLADHPEDEFAWKWVDTLLPLRRTVFPGLHHREKVSAAISRMLSRDGLARTIKAIVAEIASAPEGERPDGRSLKRLKALIREGVAWERRADATSGIGDFTAFLAASGGRETAESPHVIRILTIHRAKGLTIDHVIVPVLETGKGFSIDRPRRGTQLFDVAAGWAMEAPSREEARLNDAVWRAWCSAANESVLEQLRLHYVALTRARHSTHVFLVDPRTDSHDGKVQFRDLLLAPFPDGADGAVEENGMRVVCRLGRMDTAWGEAPAATPERERMAWRHAAGSVCMAKRTPSADEGYAGRGVKTQASALFARGETPAERGEAMHSRYAAIGWIDPAAPKDAEERAILASAWRDAFVEPEGGVELWREKRYERLVEGAWETGRLDRVVFSGTGEGRRAVVYDFKGNRPQDGETAETFAERMAKTYAGQMTSYRRAVAALANLAESSVRTILLLVATRGCVEISG